MSDKVFFLQKWNSMYLTAWIGFLLTADWSRKFVFPHHSKKNASLENNISLVVSWLTVFLSILLVCPIGHSQFKTRLCHFYIVIIAIALITLHAEIKRKFNLPASLGEHWNDHYFQTWWRNGSFFIKMDVLLWNFSLWEEIRTRNGWR